MATRTFNPVVTRRVAPRAARPASATPTPARAAGAKAGLPRFAAAAPTQTPTLSQRGDRWETEATRVADAAARAPATDLPVATRRRAAPPTRTPAVALRAAPSAFLPTTPRVTASPIVEGVTSTGAPLPAAVQRRVEAVTGVGVDAVRVHAGYQAHQAALSVNARAFTAGSHIYLRDSASADDPRLLAHETAHAIQQSATLHAAHPRGPPQRDASVLPITAAPRGMIQREETAPAPAAPEEEGILEMGFWTVLEMFVPQRIIDVLRDIRRLGLWEFLKRRISGALDSLFAGMRDQGGFTAQLADIFQSLLERGRVILAALVAGDCEPLFAAVRELRDTLSQVAGDAWNAVTEFLQPIGDYLSNLWQQFGAPVVDFLGEFASDVWEGIQGLGNELWELTRPAREYASSVWTEIKNLLGFGEGGDDDGGGGIGAWIAEQAGEVWDEVAQTLEPVIAPIREVVDQVRAILPLDAILDLRDTITGWMDNAMQMADSMEEEGDVAENQDLLRDIVLPGIRRAITSVSDRLDTASAWVTGLIGDLVARVGGFFTALSQNTLLSPFRGALQWLDDEAVALGQWARETAAGVFDVAHQALEALDTWIEPVLDALQRLVSTLGDLMGHLGDFVLGPFMLIPRCIRDPIKDFLVEQVLRRIPIFSQLLEVPNLWARAQTVFRRIVVQIFRDGNLAGAAWTFFREVIQLFGLPPQLVTNLIRNAARAIRDILNDPAGFLLNLFRAIGRGFLQFVENFGTHLLNGIANWLFGALGDTGIRVPTEFSLGAVVDVVLQVLDITQERVFRAIERRIGPERTAQLRRGLGIATEIFSLVQILATQGPAGLWREILSRLDNLWGSIVSGVTSFLMTRVIAFATRWLASLLDVTGIMPVINSIVAIYNAIQSFFQYLRQLLEIVNSVFEGLGEIARGVITRGANLVEANLGRLMPIAIGFLANQIGLGDLPNQIRRVVGEIRARVDRAIDWIVDRIVRGVQAVVSAVRSGVRTVVAAVRNWWQARAQFTGADGETHNLYFEQVAGRHELIVASRPERVGTKARAVLADTAATPDQRTKAQQILDLEAAIRANSDRVVAEGAAGRGDGPTATGYVAQINADMQTMSNLFVSLFSGPAASDLPPPQFSFTTEGGKAKTAEVKYLSANRPGGSAPAASPLGWEELQSQGLTTSGQRFVQMHLINERLGGLGVAPNLVPGSNANNREHHNTVEDRIKDEVGHNPRDTSAIARRKVVYYKVTVNYRSDSRDAAFNPTGRTFAAVGGRPAPSATYFASSITCEWGFYNENTTAAPGSPVQTRWGSAPAGTTTQPIPIELPRLALA